MPSLLFIMVWLRRSFEKQQAAISKQKKKVQNKACSSFLLQLLDNERAVKSVAAPAPEPVLTCDFSHQDLHLLLAENALLH